MFVSSRVRADAPFCVLGLDGVTRLWGGFRFPRVWATKSVWYSLSPCDRGQSPKVDAFYLPLMGRRRWNGIVAGASFFRLSFALGFALGRSRLTTSIRLVIAFLSLLLNVIVWRGNV